MGGCSSSVGPQVRPLSLDSAQYRPMLSAPSQYFGAGVACAQRTPSLVVTYWQARRHNGSDTEKASVAVTHAQTKSSRAHRKAPQQQAGGSDAAPGCSPA